MSPYQARLRPGATAIHDEEQPGDALEDHRKRHPKDKRCPGIFVVVVHHGKQPWSGPRSLQQACGLSADFLAAARHEMPDCPFLLDDLAAQSEEHLLGRSLAAPVKLMLWLLEHAHLERRLIERLPAVAGLLVETMETEGLELASAFSRYIIEVGQTSIEKLLDIVEDELDSRLEEPFMNAAEELRREGWEKGQQEGLRQGRQVTLLKLLAMRFGPVPARVRRRVCRAGDDKLDLWTERVLSARTLDEVFDNET